MSTIYSVKQWVNLTKEIIITTIELNITNLYVNIV